MAIRHTPLDLIPFKLRSGTLLEDATAEELTQEIAFLDSGPNGSRAYLGALGGW